jgi:hypothetical protein
MATRKAPPAVSRKSRTKIVPYSRRHGTQPPGSDGSAGDDAEAANGRTLAEVAAAHTARAKTNDGIDKPAEDRSTTAKPPTAAGPEPTADAPAAATSVAVAPKADERTAEAASPTSDDAPTTAPAAAATPAATGDAPFELIPAAYVKVGNPSTAELPPGPAPMGDARSLRRMGDEPEFAMVYRDKNAVVSRRGPIGRRGICRVVNYPTSAGAAHAYAQECSRLIGEGFADYVGASL